MLEVEEEGVCKLGQRDCRLTTARGRSCSVTGCVGFVRVGGSERVVWSEQVREVVFVFFFLSFSLMITDLSRFVCHRYRQMRMQSLSWLYYESMQ